MVLPTSIFCHLGSMLAQFNSFLLWWVLALGNTLVHDEAAMVPFYALQVRNLDIKKLM